MNQRHQTYIRFIVILLWFAALFTWMLSLSQASVDSGLHIYGAVDHVAGQRSVIRVVGVDTKVRHPIPIINPTHRWRKDEIETDWQPLERIQRTVWQAEITAPKSPGIWTLEVRATVRDNLVQATTNLDITAERSIPDELRFDAIPTMELSVCAP